MNDELATEVEASRFTPAGPMRTGYAMGDVDDFLDELVRRLRAGAEVGEFVSTARFSLTRLRAAYDMAEVDALLDTVVKRAGAGGAMSSGSDAKAASAGLNDDVFPLLVPQLPGSGLKEGYAKREIDALLGRLAERLAEGRTFDDLLDAPRTRTRFGYDIDATDKLLASVRYAARYA